MSGWVFLMYIELEWYYIACISFFTHWSVTATGSSVTWSFCVCSSMVCYRWYLTVLTHGSSDLIISSWQILCAWSFTTPESTDKPSREGIHLMHYQGVEGRLCSRVWLEFINYISPLKHEVHSTTPCYYQKGPQQRTEVGCQSELFITIMGLAFLHISHLRVISRATLQESGS